MGVSWQGVVFIWAIFLWPLVVSIGYAFWKGSIIPRLGVFFLLSLVAGYIIMVVVGLFLTFVARLIPENPTQPEAIATLLGILGVAALLVPSLLVTHFLSRWFEVTEEG